MNKFKEKYQRLVEQFGTPVNPALLYPGDYVIEECAELIQALQHARRGRKGANPIKEMAHVYTLMDALRYYWDVPDEEIQKWQQELIDRYLNQPNDGRHIPESGPVNRTKED